MPAGPRTAGQAVVSPATPHTERSALVAETRAERAADGELDRDGAAAQRDELAGVLAPVLDAVVVGVLVAGIEAGLDLGRVAQLVAVEVLAAVAAAVVVGVLLARVGVGAVLAVVREAVAVAVAP